MMARRTSAVALVLTVAALCSDASQQLQQRPGRRQQEGRGRLEKEAVAASASLESNSTEPHAASSDNGPAAAAPLENSYLLLHNVEHLLHARSNFRTWRAAVEGGGSAAYQSGVMAWLTGAVPVFIFALFYRSYKGSVMSCIQQPDDYDRLPIVGTGKWPFSLFQCCQAPGMCCFSCCCGVVRWADTMAMVGFFGFMCGVISLLGIMFISSITGVYIIMVVFLVYYRQQFRAKFGIVHGTCKTVLGDLGAYCCCMPCAITQEARVVELALVQNHAGVQQYLHTEGTWEHQLNETLSDQKSRYPTAEEMSAEPKRPRKPPCCGGV